MAVGRVRLEGKRSGRIVMVGLAAAFAFLLVACDSGGDSTTATTVPPVTPTTKPYTFRSMHVDIQITGSQTLVLKGLMGECRFPADGLPVAFILTGPQVGSGNYVVVWGPTAVAGSGTIPANVKAVINGTGLISPNTGEGVQVRPDLQSVSLNAKLEGPTVDVGGVGGWSEGTITGTMRCV